MSFKPSPRALGCLRFMTWPRMRFSYCVLGQLSRLSSLLGWEPPVLAAGPERSRAGEQHLRSQRIEVIVIVQHGDRFCSCDLHCLLSKNTVTLQHGAGLPTASSVAAAWPTAIDTGTVSFSLSHSVPCTCCRPRARAPARRLRGPVTFM